MKTLATINFKFVWKAFILGVLVIVIPAQAIGAAAKSGSHSKDNSSDTQKGKNFVVSGEDKLKVRSDKLLRSLFVDVDKPVKEAMQESSEISRSILPESELGKYEKAGMVSESRMTFSPWLSLITKQPILVIKTQKTDIQIKSWKFTIADETGRVLYVKDGRGKLPPQYIWDGKCRDGRLLNVGESYYYSITIIDKAGNPLITSSKVKKLNSFAYYKNNNLNIKLLSSILFKQNIKSEISSVGISLMKESCDYIIKDIGRETQINITCANPKLGQDQGEAIKEYIVERMALPKNDVKVKVLPSDNALTEGAHIICIR